MMIGQFGHELSARGPASGTGTRRREKATGNKQGGDTQTRSASDTLKHCFHFHR